MTDFYIHVETCSNSAFQEPKLVTLPSFDFSERQRQLQKYELVMLSTQTVQEFQSMFIEKKVEFNEPLFQAWLVLKNASLPTEQQMIKTVLNDHLAFDVQKKKTQRKRKLPEGPARYDPWEQILLEQLEKAKDKGPSKPMKVVAKSNKNRDFPI